jgi:gluconolactonase
MNVFRITLAALALTGVSSSRLFSKDAPSRLTEGPPKMVLEKGAGEGPAWHPKLGLLFSGGGGIRRRTLEGRSEVFRPDAGTNGLLFDAQGRLLACEPRQRRVTRTEQDGKITVIADRFKGKRFNQPNDITVDSRGRIYFSDPCYGDRSHLEIVDAKGRKVEGVYRIDLDGKVSRIITHEVDRPNGLLVTPNDRYLYVAGNNNNEIGGGRKLWRFDLMTDGRVHSKTRRLIFDWKTSRGPDGMAIDKQGRLFVAGGLTKSRAPMETNDRKGGVYVFSANGKLIGFLPVPRDEVTNCAFGGDDLKTLYITAGGTLWSVRTLVEGRPVWPRRKKR